MLFFSTLETNAPPPQNLVSSDIGVKPPQGNPFVTIDLSAAEDDDEEEDWKRPLHVTVGERPNVLGAGIGHEVKLRKLGPDGINATWWSLGRFRRVVQVITQQVLWRSGMLNYIKAPRNYINHPPQTINLNTPTEIRVPYARNFLFHYALNW